jgi:N,N'-diacetyllegionaminate synthase
VDNKVFIIAEAGVNHNGSMDTAKKLIETAADAGADAVKFQTFKAENLVSIYAEKAEYQKNSTESSESQFDMLKKLELSYENHLELIDHCRNNAIEFLSTPFDLESINMLNSLNLKIFKIPSGEITNLPYLRAIGKLNKNVIISTGMANLEEVETAYKVLLDFGTKSRNIIILHANTQYPTSYEDVNLRAMQTIAQELMVKVGYSDHTLGIEVPIAAVAMGAVIIEKHFTLNRNMPGPDHKASLEPHELKAMVVAIRNIEQAIGDGIKRPSVSEQKNILIARKSIVAAKKISIGEIINNDNITVKRPGTGISPMEWDEIIGRTAQRDYASDELIEFSL